MNSFEIKINTSSADNVYDAFIKKLSENNASVLGYHYDFYKRIIQSCGIGDAYYLELFDNLTLCAVLPGFIKSSDIGKTYSSMPFFGPNAGILAQPEYETAEVFGVMISYLLGQLSAMENILSASIYTPFLKDHRSFYLNAFKPDFSVEKSTQYLEIEKTEWSNKIKYDLRKSEKSGVSISTEITDSSVDRLYGIYLQNCKDYSIPPKPRQFIDQLAKASVEGEHVDFCFTYHEGEMVGGLIVIYSEQTVSYYLPCSLDSARSLQPVTFMIDYAFNKAKARGLKYWNWESSPSVESGVFKFKKKWGSSEATYQILIKTFKSEDYFRGIGREKISEAFNYFFVFPFNLLN